MEALNAILKVFGLIGIILLVVLAFSGTALGIRFAQERNEVVVSQSTPSAKGSSGGAVVNAERARIQAQKEADKAQAELIREQRKADRQYYLMNFPWGDLILIILCFLGTIGCVIYIIQN